MRRYHVCLLTVLVLLVQTAGMAQQRLLNIGDRNFKNLRFSKAIANYERAIDQGADGDAYLKLAECYRMVNKTESSEFWFSRVPEATEWDAEAHFQYGMAAKTNKNFAVAKQQFMLYKEKGAKDPVAVNALINSCDSASTWITEPTRDSVWLSDLLSSENGEFSPVFWEDGFIVSSNNYANALSNIDPWTGNTVYKLVKIDESGEWSQLDASINKGLNVGPASIAKNTMFYTRTIMDKRTNVNRLELFESSFDNGTWSTPKPFKYNSKNYSVGHPALTSDGEELYFISDMEDGIGGFDIYKSNRTANGWTTPRNLGSTINSVYDDVFPYIASNGNLYFSSKGHNGLGGLDIYTAQPNGNLSWGRLRNLRAPINSASDDFGWIMANDFEGYLSSSRGNTDGLDDIYHFKLAQPTCIKIMVYNTDMKRLNDVAMQLKGKDGNAPIAFKEVLDDGSAIYCFEDPADLNFLFSKDGYQDKIIDFPNADLSEGDTAIINVTLTGEIMDEITQIELKNIYFDFDKSDILPTASVELDKVVNLMEKYPNINIVLEAHCDSRGKDKYNFRLSDRRAKSAEEYIIDNGISADRIKGEGFGETQLRNRCSNGVKCSEEDHQENRRVELRISGIVPNTEIIYRD